MQNSEKVLGLDVTNGSLLPVILQLAWPSVLQAVLSNCYAFNDFLFVGSIEDEKQSSAATAALSATVGLQIIAFSVHNMIPSGANTYSAQYRGAKDQIQLAATFRAGFFACILMSTVVAIVGTLNISRIASLCNSNSDVTHAIILYFGTLLAASPAFGLMLLVDGFYKSCGNTVTPLKLEIVSLVLNTILNYVMVLKLNLGIEGAAVATAISRLVPACYGLIGIFQGRLGFRVFLFKSLQQQLHEKQVQIYTELSVFDDFSTHGIEDNDSFDENKIIVVDNTLSEDRNNIVNSKGSSQSSSPETEIELPTIFNDLTRVEMQSSATLSSPNSTMIHTDEESLKSGSFTDDVRELFHRAVSMAKIGVFESIMQLIYGAVFTLMIRLSGELGYAQQAGLGAGLRGIEWIGFCMSEGLLVAAAASVGQCIGAKQYQRAMHAALICATLSSLCAGTVGIPFILFSTEISSILSKDPLIVKYCAQYTYIVGFSMVAVGFEMASYGAFLGAGLARKVCILNGTLNLLRVPIAIYCIFGAEGFYYELLWVVCGIRLDDYNLNQSANIANITLTHNTSLDALGAIASRPTSSPPVAIGDFYCICYVIAATAGFKAVLFAFWLGYRTWTKVYFSDCSLTD